MSIVDDILQLKKERNAIILAHNYQRGEVQDIADYVGDSFGLSQKAVQADAKVIVFCGVDFMAESAAILNPDKIVLLPTPEAGCPMARMITPFDVQSLKLEHPDAEVVCYVNSSAAVKAVSDVCCTSSNAVKVVDSLQGRSRHLRAGQEPGGVCAAAHEEADIPVARLLPHAPDHHRGRRPDR